MRLRLAPDWLFFKFISLSRVEIYPESQKPTNTSSIQILYYYYYCVLQNSYVHLYNIIYSIFYTIVRRLLNV